MNIDLLINVSLFTAPPRKFVVVVVGGCLYHSLAVLVMQSAVVESVCHIFTILVRRPMATTNFYLTHDFSIWKCVNVS